MNQRPLLILMLLLSALDLASTGAFYFSLHEIKSFYGLSELELNLLIFPPTIITIILISQNSRLIDILGRRSFLSYFLSIYIIGCLIGMFGTNFICFLTARCVMAVGAAAFVTTARNLTFELHAPNDKMRGVKYYASGLAIGMAMGPFIASNISTGDIMRGAFLVFGITATACLLVNNLATTPSRAPYLTIQEDHQSIRSMPAMLSPIIILLAALTLSPTLYRKLGITEVLLSIVAAWSLYTVGILLLSTDNHKLSINALWKDSRAFRAGITAFSLSFITLGFNSYYVFNILKDTGHFTWATLGLAYSIGFMSSLIAWLFMYHFLPKTKGSKPFWVSGLVLFVAYITTLIIITNGYGGVSVFVVGIAFLGIATMFVLASTSMLTFRDLQQDRQKFGYALQIKNVLSQFFTLIGVIVSQVVFLH
ncbi:MFS transporter [Pseudomonas sp. phDV1]|nr:MFS transporter [Pseudomonas sp. phDV1]AXO63728.1 MFS transporter [Pseudomonas sp. phDV1]